MVLAVCRCSCASSIDDTELTKNPFNIVLSSEAVAGDFDTTKTLTGCGCISCIFNRSISASA